MAEQLNRLTDDGDPFATRQFEDRRPLVLPPLDLLVQREGGNVRLGAVERGRVIASGKLSGATTYVFYWVASMDPSTADGRVAGIKRAVQVGSVARTYQDRQALYGPLLTDAKFGSGYFLCQGVDDDGNVSGDVVVSAGQTGDILDASLPGQVTDLQVSESGETANGTVFSVLAFTYVAPRPKGSFVGIQPVIRDYPAVGDLTEFSPLGYGGPDGGAGGGVLRVPPARRVGDGTISIAGAVVTGVGSHFTLFAKVGDQVEVFNVRRRILTVDSDTQVTLTAAWPANPAVAALGQYAVIGKCRVYAVALSQTLAHSNDQASWPYVDVDLDGDLSAPNAPATLTLTPFGNGIRGQFAQVAGVGIRGYLVFRSEGATDDITTATQVGKEIRHDPTTPNGGTLLQFEDTNFTVFERDTGEVFRYYVRTINIRDDPSAGYATATASCRLDAPADNGDSNTAREIALNQLWNGHINGTVGNTVATGDASQDANMGGAPPGGRNRWGGATTGVGVAPGHVSNTEVVLAMSGAGAGTSILQQDVDACDNATAANRRIPTWKMLHLQWKMRTSGGQPNGIVYGTIQQFNGGVQTAAAGCVRRLSDDTIDTSQQYLAIDGSDVTTDHQVYHAAFVLDDTVVTTKIRVLISYQVTDWNGVNIFITEAMLSIGEALPQWTAQMADAAITYSRTTGTPIPPAFDPDQGSGRPWTEVIAP